MCRWMAWLGQDVLIDELLFKTQHGIVDQSLHSRLGAETTNGDGFGMGWYGAGDGPGVYHSVAPAWGDSNLRELAAHIESPLFLAHVRAAIGSPVQQTNCHPFRHGRWLFVHNGYIAEFHRLRRDLMLAIEPDHFADVQGSTDTEVVFHLALTLGLESDPIGALERIESGGALRILDALFVQRDPATDDLSAIALHGAGAGGLVAPLLGFRLDAAERRRTSERTLAEADVQALGNALAPGEASPRCSSSTSGAARSTTRSRARVERPSRGTSCLRTRCRRSPTGSSTP